VISFFIFKTKDRSKLTDEKTGCFQEFKFHIYARESIHKH